jgi:transposase-like protein
VQWGARFFSAHLSIARRTISQIVQKLDEELVQFPQRRLEEPNPYLILDASLGKAREDGAVRSQAVLIAIGFR